MVELIKKLINKFEHWFFTIIEAIAFAFMVVAGPVNLNKWFPLENIKFITEHKQYLIFIYMFIVASIGILILIKNILQNYNKRIICSEYPGNRICYPIDYFLSKSIDIDNNPCYLIKSEEKIGVFKVNNNNNKPKYPLYINIIGFFVQYAKDTLYMTLPKDPYFQINNDANYSSLKNGLKFINDLPFFVTKKKIIIFDTTTKTKFINNLLMDINQSTSYKNYSILNYIKIHKKWCVLKRIKLEWYLAPSLPDEFISIDNKVFLQIDPEQKDIEIHLKNNDMINYTDFFATQKTRYFFKDLFFDNLGNLKSEINTIIEEKKYDKKTIKSKLELLIKKC